jgi:hypothetical protein
MSDLLEDLSADTKTMLAEVDSLAEKITQLQERKKLLLRRAQGRCSHPITSIREAPYRKGILYTARPFRVCIECGLKEEGWGTGYHDLAPSIYSGIASLSREEAEKWVRR